MVARVFENLNRGLGISKNMATRGVFELPLNIEGGKSKMNDG